MLLLLLLLLLLFGFAIEEYRRHFVLKRNIRYVIWWLWAYLLAAPVSRSWIYQNQKGKNWPSNVQCCRQHDKANSFNRKIECIGCRQHNYCYQSICYIIFSEQIVESQTEPTTCKLYVPATHKKSRMQRDSKINLNAFMVTFIASIGDFGILTCLQRLVTGRSMLFFSVVYCM